MADACVVGGCHWQQHLQPCRGCMQEWPMRRLEWREHVECRCGMFAQVTTTPEEQNRPSDSVAGKRLQGRRLCITPPRVCSPMQSSIACGGDANCRRSRRHASLSSSLGQTVTHHTTQKTQHSSQKVQHCLVALREQPPTAGPDSSRAVDTQQSVAALPVVAGPAPSTRPDDQVKDPKMEAGCMVCKRCV